jgi:predicted metal-dependent hydrolase
VDINLEKAYDMANVLYFANKLPKVRVRFKKRLRIKDSEGGCLWTKPNQPEIEILDKLQAFPTLVFITLLHEMAHVKMGYRAQHGKKFKAELLRLHKIGAYDGLL